LAPQERFCGYCGTDQMAGAPQAAYGAPAQAAGGGTVARIAAGLGIGGGLTGIVWGALAPYLTAKWPDKFLLLTGTWPGVDGLKYAEVPLLIGLVLGVLAIVGGVLAPKVSPVAGVILIICGVLGFLVGTVWLIPGALLLAAGGLALAAGRA
jgi:hypothetical protein